MELTMKERRAVTKVVASRYQRARKKQKGQILDEFIEVTGYDRCYASYLLRRQGRKVRLTRQVVVMADVTKKRRRRSPPIYDGPVKQALMQVWRLMDRLCGKRLAAILPKLIQIGANSAVGGDPGGFFTSADYAAIVDYARARFITVVPEIDMPGHTNAAMASYGELTCDGNPLPVHTGIEVGFSTLCVRKDSVYDFIRDVVRDVAAETPGPYFHIGGDEVQTLSHEDYVYFIQKAQSIVDFYGKQMIGWEEVAPIDLSPTTIVEYWQAKAPLLEAADKGAQVIMAPANRSYLDMKYNASTVLGLNWAGYVEVQDSYSWDPTTEVEGLPADQIIGVEAPIWTETIRTFADLEYMAFPRLLGIAEIGWSPQAGRSWDEYRLRLAAQEPRFSAWQLNFYRSPQVPWK